MAVCARFITNKWLLRSKTLNSILTVRTLKVPSDTPDSEKKDKNEQIIDRTFIKALVKDANRGDAEVQADWEHVRELQKLVDEMQKKLTEVAEKDETIRLGAECQEAQAVLKEILKYLKLKEELIDMFKIRIMKLERNLRENDQCTKETSMWTQVIESVENFLRRWRK